MQILKANSNHFEQIIEIYNWAIINTTSTLDTEPKTLSNYKPFLDSLIQHPFLVIMDQGKLIGWACLKPYSDRLAYQETTELSIYLDPKFHNKGYAHILLTELFRQATQYKIHTVISRVTVESAASIHLHKKFGFFEVGTLKEVGHKFGKLLDVLIMQKFIKTSA